MILPALLSALAVLASGPLDEQSASVGVEQIGAQDTPGQAMGDIGDLQLGAPVRAVQPAEPPPPPAPLAQLNEDRPTAAPPEGQPDAVPFERPSQVNQLQATAEAPSGPASPFPRRTTVDPVSGDDACDPGRPTDPGDEVCAHRIETRADEFAPPEAPPLSAEERLLADNDARGLNADASARKLAAGDVDAGATQAYAFSSGLSASPDVAAPKVSPETQKAMDAAAQLLGSLPASAIITTR
jgi:hypothetical protein